MLHVILIYHLCLWVAEVLQGIFQLVFWDPCSLLHLLVGVHWLIIELKKDDSLVATYNKLVGPCLDVNRPQLHVAVVEEPGHLPVLVLSGVELLKLYSNVLHLCLQDAGNVA